jgi:signal transduction histidine kinase
MLSKKRPFGHITLLRFAGLLTWAIVAIPLVWAFQDAPENRALWRTLATVFCAYSAFGLAYWLVTRGLGLRQPGWFDHVLLVILTFSAIAISYLTGTGLAGILLMIVSVVIPWLLPLPVGIPWLLLQNFALVPVFMLGEDFGLLQAVLQAALYIGTSSFAFVTSLVAKQQAQAREEQRRLNSELRATRALLAESSRMSERLRISRELHDLLGHHLTALSLNLEVAGHLTEGKAQEHVRQSHALARLLLTDVREAVSQLREDGAVDLIGAVNALVDGVPGLRIELDLPGTLSMDDPARAQALLRCMQEIITNAVRHAGASRLQLALRQEGRAFHLQANDDGRGCENVAPGNGLTGMRERLQPYGGTVEVRTAPGEGFALDIRMPLGEGA